MTSSFCRLLRWSPVALSWGSNQHNEDDEKGGQLENRAGTPKVFYRKAVVYRGRRSLVNDPPEIKCFMLSTVCVSFATRSTDFTTLRLIL
jgi:hypothetical protein